MTKPDRSGLSGIRKLPNIPVFSTILPDHEVLNLRLREKMLAMAESVPDVVTNTKYGTSFFENKWLSRNHLFKDPDHSIQALVRSAEQIANKIATAGEMPYNLAITSMWCIVSKSGLTGRPHSHEGVLSGAYYVDAGESSDDSGGSIQFFAPRSPKHWPSHMIVPTPGLILLFPSKLKHCVPTYSSSEPRIVISFNLKKHQLKPSLERH